MKTNKQELRQAIINYVGTDRNYIPDHRTIAMISNVYLGKFSNREIRSEWKKIRSER